MRVRLLMTLVNTGEDMAHSESHKPTVPPESPTQLGKKSWWNVLKRTVSGYQANNLGDRAATLTYYAVLSIFPMLLVLVSILGLFGSTVTRPLFDNVSGFAAGPARDIVSTSLQELQNSQHVAGIALFIGLVVALWSASGYVGAFMRTSNAVYAMPEGRPTWKTLPVRLAITGALIVLLVVSVIGVVFTGSLADDAGQMLGVGHAAVVVWNVAKWPVLMAIVALVFAVLYWAAPNVRHPGFRWITPGSVLAVVMWISASAAFGFYVANFGSYNKTYGTLAATIIFLVWLWISNVAILLGLQLDAELERGRAIEAGYPPEKRPFLEPRDTSGLETPPNENKSSDDHDER